MTENVDLVAYLPPFLKEFKEIAVALEAENPEFILVWNATERVLSNEFIETADEYGISRFEKLLNVFPSKEDTLESRRARVQARWISTIPYTLKMLTEKLITLCGDSDFEIVEEYAFYRVVIKTHLELFGQVEELNNLLGYMLPANIVVLSENKIRREYGNSVSVGTAIGECIITVINSELNSRVIYRQSLNGLTATSTRITCVVN